MRAALVLIVLSTSIASAETTPPEVDLATTWVKDSQSSVDAAVAKLGASFRQVTKAIGGEGCLKKFKVGLIAAAKRKAFVTCAGKVFEEISPGDGWKVFAAAEVPDDYKPFAKQFPKTATFVRGSYSEGFIFVVLGDAKDGARPVIGLWIDRSQAG